MLKLNDGRQELWQWDTGRTATVKVDCDAVHFANLEYGKAYVVEVEDGTVRIPNELLVTGADLICWAFVGSAEEGYTKKSKKFEVKRRAKPSDYVFTLTDQISLEEIIERVEKLEESGGGGGSSVEVDETLTVAGAAAEAKAVGERFEEQSKAIADKIDTPETAEVGQMFKVSAVDENSRVTEIEAVDMPSGTPDAVQYVTQTLTEEQQMQARKNLGLYNSTEQPIILAEYIDVYGTGAWSYVKDGAFKTDTVLVELAGVEYLCERQSQYNYATDATVDWYGNAGLIPSDHHPDAVENKYPDYPFVAYEVYDDYYAVISGMSGVVYLTMSDPYNTENVYETVPQEFVPALDKIILNSSDGSGKQFYVTVDEAGTLSVTEVKE